MMTNNELCTAVLNADISKVKQAIKQNLLKIDSQFTYPCTTENSSTKNASLLHIAVVNKVAKNIALLQALLEKYQPSLTADILNQVNEYGTTPIHMAAFYGNIDAILLLVHYGANPTLTMADGKITPLILIKRTLDDALIAKMELIVEKYNNKADLNLTLIPTHLFEENIPNQQNQTRLLGKFQTKIKHLYQKFTFFPEVKYTPIKENPPSLQMLPDISFKKMHK